MSFRGQVAVITGGGSGMGQAWARRLAKDGATVAILDVNEAGMAETAASASNIKPYALDITDADAVASVFADIEASLGPVDRVANAAAIMPFGRLLEEDPKLTTRVMAINYGGLVNVARAALPKMIERWSGDFVSFSSMTGIVPGLLMGAYASSKAAVSFILKFSITKIVTVDCAFVASARLR